MWLDIKVSALGNSGRSDSKIYKYITHMYTIKYEYTKN